MVPRDFAALVAKPMAQRRGFPFSDCGPLRRWANVDRGVRRRWLIPRFTVLLDEKLIECRLYPTDADHGSLGQEFPMQSGQSLDRRLVAPVDVQEECASSAMQGAR